jgi:hypothetical protein
LKNKALDVEIQALNDTLEGIYLIINSDQFGFVPSDPTRKSLHDVALVERRQRLLNKIFEDLITKYSIKIST